MLENDGQVQRRTLSVPDCSDTHRTVTTLKVLDPRCAFSSQTPRRNWGATCNLFRPTQDSTPTSPLLLCMSRIPRRLSIMTTTNTGSIASRGRRSPTTVVSASVRKIVTNHPVHRRAPLFHRYRHPFAHCAVI